MRHRIASLAATVLLVAIALSALAVPAGASRAEVRTERSEVIDAWINERMTAHDLPGVAVAVVTSDETVHIAGYGRQLVRRQRPRRSVRPQSRPDTSAHRPPARTPRTPIH